MNENLNVTVTYALSAAGQRAALLAGRNASATVTELMPLTNTALLEALEIGADGSLRLDASRSYVLDGIYRESLKFDAPPATIEEIIVMVTAAKARIDAAAAERRAEYEARIPQTIELDCPPGNPRPGDLIGAMIKDTGLELKEPIRTFFGNWTWDYSEVSEDEWKRIREIVRPRIEALYQQGTIRYGSW